MLRTLAVQGQLFAPFQYRLVIVIEFVLGFTQYCHVSVDAGYQQKTAPDGDSNPQCRNGQHFAGEPGEIGRRTNGQNNTLHQLRQADKRNGDGAHVAGQPCQQRGTAELLDALHLGIQDPLDKLAAQAEDEMMPESRQRQLGTQRDRHQQ